MSLVEFLFVDKPRLDSYFEQIQSPIAYDKVPVWSAEFSLAGPKAAGGQTRQARQWTTFEKIQAVMKYLKEHKLLEYERERRKAGGVTELRFEKCEARKAFIPPDKSRFADFQGLNMWIAPGLGEPGPGMLFLIEDFPKDDMPPAYTQPSGYSALLTLVAEIRESLERTLIGHLIVDKLRGAQERALAEFAGDPIGFLKDLGARISDVRRIQTTYRVRTTLLDCSPNPSGLLSQDRTTNWNCYCGVSTVGYPLVVVDGDAGALI